MISDRTKSTPFTGSSTRIIKWLLSNGPWPSDSLIRMRRMIANRFVGGCEAPPSGLTDNSRVEGEVRIIQSDAVQLDAIRDGNRLLDPEFAPNRLRERLLSAVGSASRSWAGFRLAAAPHLPKRAKRFESGSFGRQACCRFSGGRCDHRKRWYKIDCCGHQRVDVAARLLGMCGSDQSGPIAHALRDHREHQSGVSKLSVAFVKEESAEAASETLLPDRPISPHPNLVTEAGLKALELQLQQAREAYSAASTIEDVNERRRQAANPLRDLRYLAARVRTAQVIPDPTSFDNVAFGSTVTFSRDDGRVQTYRVVGEDEADPKAGSISFVSPVARTLIGKTIGDVVSVGGKELEVIAIS